MRITFYKTVAGVDAFGGGSVHFRGISHALAQRGNQIGVFRDGAAVNGHRTFPMSRWGALQAGFWSDVIYVRVAAHSTSPGAIPRSLDAIRGLKRIAVAWEMNAPIDERTLGAQNDSQARQRLEEVRARAKSVDVAFCVSQEMVDYASNVIGLKNVVYVPNGADCEQFSPTVLPAAEIARDESTPVLFWMGAGHYPWEGDRIVVELARRLAERGVACRIVMAGERRAGLEELPENVLHVGRVPHVEIGRYAAAADICLCLYDLTFYGDAGFYGSPIKLYEYMAAGKAIVATRTGEIERTIRHEEDGLLVGTSLDDIEVAVVRLLSEPAFRQRLGQAARLRAEQHYNWDRAARQTEEALVNVL